MGGSGFGGRVNDMSKKDSTPSFDPMKSWRDWIVKNEREWSESLSKVMKDETVARAMGQEVNASVYRQQMVSQAMAGPMAAMNMPTRDDVVALGERIGRLEDAVARVEALLVQMGGATNVAGTRKTPKQPAATS